MTDEQHYSRGWADGRRAALAAKDAEIKRQPAGIRDLAVALAAKDAELAKLREVLQELAEAAEHDMKMNQGGDNHEDEPESSGGWWSMRNQRAIAAAQAALSSMARASALKEERIGDANPPVECDDQ